MTNAIEVESVSREFVSPSSRWWRRGDTTVLHALSDVSLVVPRGEVFGLLGPNGAGKTTLIRILVTILAPSAGRARIAGYDVVESSARVRPLINSVSGAEQTGYGLLTVRENLWMFSQFYGLDSRTTRLRTDRFLRAFGIADRADSKLSELSTGLRQRVNLIRALVTDPEVLFLDEPTLGLDVESSRAVRELITGWIAEQPQRRCVFLTTHILAEADELCHRVGIIDAGRLLACDAPKRLKARFGTGVTFEIDLSAPLDAEAMAIVSQWGVARQVGQSPADPPRLTMVLSEDGMLRNVLNALWDRQVRVLTIARREPTLADAFVSAINDPSQSSK